MSLLILSRSSSAYRVNDVSDVDSAVEVTSLASACVVFVGSCLVPGTSNAAVGAQPSSRTRVKISSRRRSSAVQKARSYRSGIRLPGAQCPMVSRSSRGCLSWCAQVAAQFLGECSVTFTSISKNVMIRLKAACAVPLVAARFGSTVQSAAA